MPIETLSPLAGPYRLPSRTPSSLPPLEIAGMKVDRDTLLLSGGDEGREVVKALKDLEPDAPRGIVIQSLKYDDLVSGRSQELLFERDPGSLLPPMTTPALAPMKDPLTGDPRLALREARVRVSAGRYDVVFKVDGDGTPSFSKLYLDGKSVTGLAADYVRRQIKEDPALWGTLTAAAAAGVLAAGHAVAKKTGEPIDFDLASFKVYRSEHLTVKAKVRAELTGDDRFMRSGGGEIGATYVDGRLQAGAGLRYRPRTGATELATNLSYRVDKTSSFGAAATYDSKTKDRAIWVSYQSTF